MNVLSSSSRLSLWSLRTLAAGTLVLAGCDRTPEGEVAFDRIFVREAVVRLHEGGGGPIGRPDALLPWGDRIAVADGLQGNVKLFSRDGRWERTLGRAGDGPGEFRFPARLAEGGDGSLLVFDAAHGRVSVFSAEGDFVRAWPVSHPEVADLEPAGDGGLVAATRGDGRWRVVRMDADGRPRGPVDSLPADARVYEANVSGAGVAVLGSFVAVSSAVSDTLRIHDMSTGTTRHIALGGGTYAAPQWPARPFSGADEGEALARWINAQTWTGDVLPLGGEWMAVGLLRPGEVGTVPAHRYALARVRGEAGLVTTPQPLLLRPWTAGRVAALRIDDEGGVEVAVFRFVPPAGDDR